MCGWHVLFLYFLSHCIHALNHPYELDFFLEIFLWRLVSVLFVNNLLFVTQYHPHNCGWCVIRARVHWQMASNNQYALSPSVFPTKIVGVRSQLCSKRSPKGPFSENFRATGGFFECNTYRNMRVLGCLKKKEEEDKQFCFQPFQVSHLRTSFSYF